MVTNACFNFLLIFRVMCANGVMGPCEGWQKNSISGYTWDTSAVVTLDLGRPTCHVGHHDICKHENTLSIFELNLKLKRDRR